MAKGKPAKKDQVLKKGTAKAASDLPKGEIQPVLPSSPLKQKQMEIPELIRQIDELVTSLVGVAHELKHHASDAHDVNELCDLCEKADTAIHGWIQRSKIGKGE